MREADAAAHGAAADTKLAELTARLTDAEAALLQTTKDHILGAVWHVRSVCQFCTRSSEGVYLSHLA